MREFFIYLKLLIDTAAAIGRRNKGRIWLAANCLAISRIFQMVAFFLPIKILIILSAEKTPNYFKIFEPHLGRDGLIGGLILAVPTAYLLHMLLGVASRRITDSDADFQRSMPLPVGNRTYQGKRLEIFHGKISKASSEVVLIALVIFPLILLAPFAGSLIAILAIICMSHFYRVTTNSRKRTRLTIAKLTSRQYIEYISSSLFLVVFFFLAVYVHFYKMPLLSAILFLLLSRMIFQAMQRLSLENASIADFIRRSKGRRIDKNQGDANGPEGG